MRNKPSAKKALAAVCGVAALAAGAAGFLAGEEKPVPPAGRGGRSGDAAEASIEIDRTVSVRLRDALRIAADVEGVSGGIRLPDSGSGSEDGSYCVEVATAGGLVLMERGQRLPLRIASVTKLFTTVAAVLAVGVDYRFETKLVLVGPKRGGEGAEGFDVAYLVGTGDPYLVSGEFEEFWGRETGGGPATRLERLADEVAQAGVRRIGTIYGDGSFFDSAVYPPTVPASLIEQRLLPPVAALSVDRNLAEWSGGIQKAEFTKDPAGQAASRFAAALRRRGVAVGRAGSGSASGDAQAVREFVLYSAPLGDLLPFINGHSDNFAAEMLAKRIAASGGQQGSWPGFRTRVVELLRRHGIPLAETQLDDGSGLSGNRSTCADVTALLAGLSGVPDASVIIRSLAAPGAPGTLEDRYTGLPGSGRLRAKTGSLGDVSALGGIVDAENPSAVVFSVLINGSAAKELRSQVEEPVVRALVASVDRNVQQ